jgi:hypothetical protein
MGAREWARAFGGAAYSRAPILPFARLRRAGQAD